MTPIGIFISSVQDEFVLEREHLRNYLRGDPLMRRYFEVFVTEELPADKPDEVYLDEVGRCDIYVGIFGFDYGFEGENAVSPTERAYNRATELDKHRLIFVRNSNGGTRHPKMSALINRTQMGLMSSRFTSSAELLAGLYASLVRYLEEQQLVRVGPFDASECTGATIDDLDIGRMYGFIGWARSQRQFVLPPDAEPADLLRHLHLLNGGQLINAAVLLFGKAPQRFIISSEVKCILNYGTELATPIPYYRICKGTVFQMVDQAVGFVMGNIGRAVGTRAESVQAPVTYELPEGIVREAIVNAVAHRNYADNGCIQVMVFRDRLEVLNSGRLPSPLTVEKLRVPHPSIPANPLIAEGMYLMRYTDKIGSGTLDMIRMCAEAGIPEPEFEAGAGFVTRIWRSGHYARQFGFARAERVDIENSPACLPGKAGLAEKPRVTALEIGNTGREIKNTGLETGKTSRETGGLAEKLNMLT